MSTEITTTEPEQSAQLATGTGFDNPNSFDFTVRAAMALAKSTIIPDSFKANPANCMIAIDLSNRLNVSPLTIMQNLYVVKGKPSFATQFLIASFNLTGKYSTLAYNEVGERGKESWGYYCTANELLTGKELKGATVTIEMARKEDWFKNTKWSSMPEQMLRFRAAAFFIRQYVPEVGLGLLTREEAEDIYAEQKRSELIGKLKSGLQTKEK